jgi:hypothetical protein
MYVRRISGHTTAPGDTAGMVSTLVDDLWGTIDLLHAAVTGGQVGMGAVAALVRAADCCKAAAVEALAAVSYAVSSSMRG